MVHAPHKAASGREQPVNMAVHLPARILGTLHHSSAWVRAVVIAQAWAKTKLTQNGTQTKATGYG